MADRITGSVTVKELREALANLPDNDPIMLLGSNGDATWLKRIKHDARARTVDLEGD